MQISACKRFESMRCGLSLKSIKPWVAGDREAELDQTLGLRIAGGSPGKGPKRLQAPVPPGTAETWELTLQG